MDIRSFHDVIYVNRQQLKNYQLLEESYCWPQYVDVMDDSFTINGPYCLEPENEPGSMYAWVEFQFRVLHTCPLNDISTCLRIWWGLYEQIMQWLIDEKRYGNVKWPSVQALIYNTTWALLGYNDDEQDPAAVLLATELMASPSFQKYAPTARVPSFDGTIKEPPKVEPFISLAPQNPRLPPRRPLPPPRPIAIEDISDAEEITSTQSVRAVLPTRRTAPPPVRKAPIAEGCSQAPKRPNPPCRPPRPV